MVNRRDFLMRAGAVMALAAPLRADLDAITQTDAPIPDRLRLGEWDIVWIGWHEPVNQVIALGYWYAKAADRHWVSCTLGTTCPLQTPFHVFDTTYDREHGSLITRLSTEADKEDARRKAMQRLLVSLKTGVPYGRVYS